LAFIDLKTHQPPATKKKRKKDQKSDATPQSRRLSSILGITSHSEGKLLILTYVNRYKAFIFEGIII